jgi:hypothetical protein
MQHLLPCPACNRHVRTREERCPFCDATLDFADVRPPAFLRIRLNRAALFMFTATFGTGSVVACSSSGGVYGAPPWDAASHDAGTSDASDADPD